MSIIQTNPDAEATQPMGAELHAERDHRAKTGHDAGQDDCWIAETLERLSHSSFRSSFTLSAHDVDYARRKGRELIDRHAHEMLTQRVGPAHPCKDGKQTPWRGHPVFTAQHATACCCRGCIEKWHHIPRGRALSSEQIDWLARLVMAWIDRDLATHPAKRDNTDEQAAVSRHGQQEDADGGEQPAEQPRSCSPAGRSQNNHHASKRDVGRHDGNDTPGFIQGQLL